MPGLVETPTLEVLPEPEFSVVHQKVHISLDLTSRRIDGHTEITINPHAADLKRVRLHCRQARITSVKFNPRGVVSTHHNYDDPYSSLKLPFQTTAHQHHVLQERLKKPFTNTPELEITVPKSVKIFEQGSTIVLDNTGRRDAAANDLAQAGKNVADQSSRFTPITIYIDFVIDYIRDGLHFVGWDEDDLRYPHVYTQNAIPLSMSCLFPCLDSINSRCTWEISIKAPRTIGDALRNSASDGGRDETSQAGGPQRSFSEENKGLDLFVACSGDLTDEIIDPKDSSKKTTSFLCSTPLAPQQIGFAIGPFEEVNLTSFRETDEDERLGKNAIPLHAFCLPGRAAEVRNTCLPLAKAMDYFVTTYGSYPFSSYKLCFVDEMLLDHVETASLSLCYNRMLFPADVIDPIIPITRELAFALASQWSGVHITPAESTDLWAVVGLAYYMTDMFLRKLSGNNEYRFRQKVESRKLCKMDIGRPSIHESGSFVSIDRSYYELIALKAPLVLFILDRRLTKASGSTGLSRIISRIFLNAKVGGLPNGALSTSNVIRTCERTGHTKLDVFFNQWVYGAGYPSFIVQQKFNKKKLVVEITISQEEKSGHLDQDIIPSDFMREVKEDKRSVFAPPPQSLFTGPMTIRIHEADGTPYEHIVEIKDRIARLEIPYNTKYKRLKRSRRQRERVATGLVNEMAIDGQEDMLVYSLGDVLQSEQEMQDWRFGEWSKEDEEKMSQESYEWIRLDADFEWICNLHIAMPPWMYVSQLQQDRDVVAQYETVRWLAVQPQRHPLVPTILVRTFLDNRYFHGIRTAAAEALGEYAVLHKDELAIFHLRKSFQELYCHPGSQMTKANDFADFPLYYIQCTLPRAMASIRDNRGRAPLETRKFLYEILRYNDNGDNEYSDCYYVATLMKALADALASAPLHGTEDDMMVEDDDDYDFFKACLIEIDKQRRRDEWIPTYHNILSTTALTCRHQLAKAGCIPKKPLEFLQYAQQGGFEDLRIAAFDHLLDLGYGRTDSFISFFLSQLGTDSSPYVRRNVLRLFGRFLGSVAIGSEESSKKASEESQQSDDLVIELKVSTENRKAELARKKTIPGALKALKAELEPNEALKKAIWAAVCSQTGTLPEMEELLLMCSFLYEPRTAMMVVLQYPRYWLAPELERIPSSTTGVKPRLLAKFRKGPVRTKRLAEKWTPMAPRPAPKRDTISVNGTKPAVPSLKIRAPSKPSKISNPSPTASTPQSAGPRKLKLFMKPRDASSGSPPSTGARTPQ